MARHTQSFHIPEGKISEHMQSMLESQKFGDVIIEADSKEFRVYRGILQMRSPVFAAMFEHPFEEQNKNRVVIQDTKHEVVQEMLTYMYTDTAPNLKNVAADLLVMADKYNLERLKIMCEATMGAKLTKENAIDTLILADTHDAAQLKTCAINFIAAESSHFLEKSILENTAARLVADNRPNLIAEMTKAFFNSRSEATFTFKKENFSKMEKEVRSPPCMIQNLPWKILIKPKTSDTGVKTVGFYLECNRESKSSSWSCYARAKLLILSQKEDMKNSVRKIDVTFSPENTSWGFPGFIDWNDVINPSKGFIKDDTVIFQARVNTDSPNSYY